MVLVLQVNVLRNASAEPEVVADGMELARIALAVHLLVPEQVGANIRLRVKGDSVFLTRVVGEVGGVVVIGEALIVESEFLQLQDVGPDRSAGCRDDQYDNGDKVLKAH